MAAAAAMAACISSAGSKEWSINLLVASDAIIRQVIDFGEMCCERMSFFPHLSREREKTERDGKECRMNGAASAAHGNSRVAADCIARLLIPSFIYEAALSAGQGSG